MPNAIYETFLESGHAFSKQTCITIYIQQPHPSCMKNGEQSYLWRVLGCGLEYVNAHNTLMLLLITSTNFSDFSDYTKNSTCNY